MVDDEYRKERKFESGLRGPIQDRVNMLNMPTYAGVLDKAILAEANLNRYQSSSEGQRKRQNYDNRRVPFNAKKRMSTDSSSNSNQEGNAKPMCASCGKQHFGVCRWATGACYECGEIGHRVKDCPKAGTDNGKRNGSTSGSAQNNNVGRTQARQGRVFALVPVYKLNAEAVVSGPEGKEVLEDVGRKAEQKSVEDLVEVRVDENDPNKLFLWDHLCPVNVNFFTPPVRGT
ncbi:uncharacterized protein LOC114292558 [Camellia sinensis]|uniref:uncharacterized protein LOC114292558 n=1 Tax=Camellia sinensis TaxID=4442 RepID=UPI0010357B72|nr:uncharacterized protein LOC114292558 [Camellia sinensis]